MVLSKRMRAIRLILHRKSSNFSWSKSSEPASSLISISVALLKIFVSAGDNPPINRTINAIKGSAGKSHGGSFRNAEIIATAATTTDNNAIFFFHNTFCLCCILTRVSYSISPATRILSAVRPCESDISLTSGIKFENYEVSALFRVLAVQSRHGNAVLRSVGRDNVHESLTEIGASFRCLRVCIHSNYHSSINTNRRTPTKNQNFISKNLANACKHARPDSLN